MKKKFSEEKILQNAFKNHADGNIEKAEKLYKRFIQQGYINASVYSNYGLILRDKNKFKEAEFYTKEAIKLDPSFANAYSNLGLIYKDQGKDQEAQINIKKAIELKPDFIDAYINLAYLQINNNNIEESKNTFLKILDLNPNLADVHMTLGILFKNENLFSKAIFHIERAIEINPNLIAAFLNLAILQKEIGQIDEAIISIQKALNLDPRKTELNFNLGLLFKQKGNYKEAEFYLRKTIKLDQNYFPAFLELGNLFFELGENNEAEYFLKKYLSFNPKAARTCANLGLILQAQEKFSEAETYMKNSILIDPNLSEAYSNLGNLMTNMGNLKEAIIYIKQSLVINPNLAIAYFLLSKLNNILDEKALCEYLFSEKIELNNNEPKDKCLIFFARSNVLHSKKMYKESAKFLKMANDIKLKIYASDREIRIEKSNKLLIETKKYIHRNHNFTAEKEKIFIIGMPRCGSTLLESILSINPNVLDIGESDLLEKSFFIWQREYKDANNCSLENVYEDLVGKFNNEKLIVTNKHLYNYQYAGLITEHFSKAKIIHCYRNPLDNIISIYRANFAVGNYYSSSLEDCAKVYIDHQKTISLYKKYKPSRIYSLDYDKLVMAPKEEIKKLISWLSWDWNESYLEPQNNPRIVQTASKVEVRKPINSKSVGGWKNYKNLLEPARKILEENDK